MTWAHPMLLWALLGVPLLAWWLLRREPDRAVLLPSLLFLEDEDVRLHAARPRTLTWRGWVALGVLACLVLTAAGPGCQSTERIRRVRLVMPDGPRVHERGQRDAVAARVRRHLGANDRLEQRWLPGVDHPEGLRRRPGRDTVLASLEADDVDLVVVADDRTWTDVPSRVATLGLGGGATDGWGFVAVHWREDTEVPTLRLVARVPPAGSRALLRTAPDGDPGTARDVALPAPGPRGEVVVDLPVPDTADRDVWWVWPEDVRAQDGTTVDDRIRLRGRPRRIAFDPRLGEGVRDALARALDAGVGPAGWTWDASAPDVAVVLAPGHDGPAAPVRLVLSRLADADAGVASTGSRLRWRTDPLTTGLEGSLVSGRWPSQGAHAPDAVPQADTSGVLLSDGDRAVLWRAGDDVHLAWDLLRGRPALATRPVWPLLVHNLVTAAPGGRRIEGRVSADFARVGPWAVDTVAAALAGTPAPPARDALALWPLLLILAGVGLVLLWGLPARAAVSPTDLDTSRSARLSTPLRA